MLNMPIKLCESQLHCQLKGHEPKRYEAIGGVDGLFFIIYSIKHVQDRINTLNP